MVSPSPPYPIVARLEQFRSGTFRIDILRRGEDGFFKVDALDVDPTRTDDIEELSERVYACAVQHAEEFGRGGKYRMLIRRQVLHEKEKRAATFKVETWYERRERERTEKRERRKRRRIRVPLDAQQVLMESMMEIEERIADASRELGRIESRQYDRSRADLDQFVALYKAGLKLTDEVEREREELRIRRAIAAAEAKADAKVWAVFGPLMEDLMDHIRQQVESDDADE